MAQVDPAAGAVAADVQPGDKVVRVSASFGADVWDALNFGQVVYAIKTRNGEVYLQLRRNYGDLTQLEVRSGAGVPWDAPRMGGAASPRALRARRLKRRHRRRRCHPVALRASALSWVSSW